VVLSNFCYEVARSLAGLLCEIYAWEVIFQCKRAVVVHYLWAIVCMRIAVSVRGRGFV
jgi:hypothetical protein